MSHPVAIIGGGLTGLSAAITVAESGVPCTLFEAAPQLGGRTGSWYHRPSQCRVDHGPHLLLGCYHHLLGLLTRAGGSRNIHWQPSLSLPLWSADRGHFSLSPKPWLPLQLALPHAISGLPGHHLASVTSLIRLADSAPAKNTSVKQWLQRHRVPQQLINDLLEPLCLGSMNETIASANASSFALVLDQAFASHQNARIGWFRQPLAEALIAPLASYAKRLGVKIRTGHRVRGLRPHFIACSNGEHGPYTAIILALPPIVRNKLLSIDMQVETRSISNHHFWFERSLHLPTPLIGGIGTHGQWLFDIDAMTDLVAPPHHHYCVVISDAHRSPANLTNTLLKEMEAISGSPLPALTGKRTLQIHHATHPVRDSTTIPRIDSIIDACEQPRPGELPATMERAVISGHRAAVLALSERNATPFKKVIHR